MKKLLGILMIFSLIFTTPSNVIACNFGNLWNGGESNSGSGGGAEQERRFHKLNIMDEVLNYEYSTRDDYFDSINYYLDFAERQYIETIEFFRFENGQQHTNIKNFFSVLEGGAILRYGYWLYDCMWNSLEAQWNILKVDEFDNNYQLEDLKSLSLESAKEMHDKNWYSERLSKLKNYKKYFNGESAETITTSGWCKYGLGFEEMVQIVEEILEKFNATDEEKRLLIRWKEYFSPRTELINASIANLDLIITSFT